MATSLVWKQHFMSWWADEQFAYLFALFESIQDANEHTKKIYSRMVTNRPEFTPTLLERVYDACKAIADRNHTIQQATRQKMSAQQKKMSAQQKKMIEDIKQQEQQAARDECIEDILLLV